ncbi:MAG: hypothetical protein KGL39_12805 [Patescibacteria group bacterium]|nr:hypothetical protein [Patescibacteria group bacterium]
MKRYPEPGTRIYCKGMGKHGPGTVTKNPPISAATYKDRGFVTYRCDWNKGEHLVKLADCRLLKPKVFENPRTNRDDDEEGQEAVLTLRAR